MHAIDTNILLDILLPNPTFLKFSKQALEEAHSKGHLVISEIVYAELGTQFDEEADLKTFLVKTGIRLVPSSEATLWLASRLWKKQADLKKKGTALKKSGRVLADFLVGAHAQNHANILLTRDRGFYRAYFSSLEPVRETAKL